MKTSRIFRFVALTICLAAAIGASAADTINLESLFLRPLGITRDINTLTADQFEAEIKGRIEYVREKNDVMESDDFRFPTFTVNIAGVELRPSISFGSGLLPLSVTYMPTDRKVDGATKARIIEEAIIKSGYHIDEKQQNLFDELNEDENLVVKIFAINGANARLTITGKRKLMSLSGSY